MRTKEERVIVLPKRPPVLCDKSPIKITPAAYTALVRIQSKSNLSLKELASRIIIQAEDIIVYKGAEDEDDE